MSEGTFSDVVAHNHLLYTPCDKNESNRIFLSTGQVQSSKLLTSRCVYPSTFGVAASGEGVFIRPPPALLPR